MNAIETLTQETVTNLSRLIQAPSVNPPGNEVEAIQVVQTVLEQAGLPPESWTIVAAHPQRPNLIARLRGDGSLPPLLLSGHVDVVPVEPEHWTHDPFGGQVIDEMVWGRGALDMKGFLAMYLTIFLEAWRQKLPLKRDLILAAIADEEAGFEYGSQFLVEQHPDLVRAEYGLTEAGGLTVEMAGRRVYAIQVAEKSVCWMKMRTQGQPGHGSMPHRDNAVLHLAQALERLRRKRRLPVHLSRTVQRMLTILGRELPFPAGLLVRGLRTPWLAARLLDLLPAGQGELFNALLTNTVSPTMLQAGLKANVIPSSAEASLDCRLLPGQTPADVQREITAITGPGVTLEPIYTTAGAEFSTETPLYRLMEQALQQMDPQGVVIPYMMPGATDASQYQRLGIQMYGFTPGILPAGFTWTRLSHGHDERLPIQAIRSGLPALWQVVTGLCT